MAAQARNTTIDTYRKRARAMKKRMDGIGVAMSLQQAYEAIAASDGYANWATLQAAFCKASKEASALRGYVHPIPETYDDQTTGFLERLRWTSERMQDSVADFMQGGDAISGAICVVGADHERMDAVEKISRRLFLRTFKFEQGPLEFWNAFAVPGFRSDYSNIYGPTWAPFFDGIHHLSNAAPEFRSDAERALSDLDTRLANLRRGAVIFLGFSDPEAIPASVASRSSAVIAANDVARHLKTSFTGVPGSATSSLRNPEEPHPPIQGLWIHHRGNVWHQGEKVPQASL
jgi:hypothetical protein